MDIPPKPSKIAANLPKAYLDPTTLPKSAPDGTLMVNTGKYARMAVLTAFEMIGGTKALAEWAEENPEKFYTQLFGKTISKDVEHTASQGVESLLERLDYAAGGRQDDPIDVEFEVLDDEDEDT